MGRPYVTEYVYESEQVPEAFQDFRIVAISDLHSKEIGKGNKKLIQRIDQVNPDAIMVAGDMVTDHGKNMDVSLGPHPHPRSRAAHNPLFKSLRLKVNSTVCQKQRFTVYCSLFQSHVCAASLFQHSNSNHKVMIKPLML